MKSYGEELINAHYEQGGGVYAVLDDFKGSDGESNSGEKK